MKRIVLVRPRNPLNIGAAARAMANFGFSDLVVVNPHPPVWEEARRAAPGAALAVLRAARAAASLAQAVDDCTLVVGATSGARRKLDGELLDLSALRPGKRTALVFGPEKTGLSNEELSLCHLWMRIPTLPAAPSMNLAQAVAVCCYELSRKPAAPARQAGGPSHGDLLRLLDLTAPMLEAAGFFDARTRAARLRKLRRILLRANLSAQDVALLTAAARQLSYPQSGR